MLPLPDRMEYAIEIVVNNACSNLHFLETSSPRLIAREVYEEGFGDSRDRRDKSLGLFYAVLALAQRFNTGGPERGHSTGEGATQG